MLSFVVKFTSRYYQMSLTSCLGVKFIGGVYKASFWVVCYRLNLLVVFTDEVYKSSLRVMIVVRTLRSQIWLSIL